MFKAHSSVSLWSLVRTVEVILSVKGKLDLVKACLGAMEWVISALCSGVTVAAQHNFMKIVEFLVSEKHVPLHQTSSVVAALKGGHMDMVKFLIDSGANIHAENAEGEEACCYACLEGTFEMIKFLLEKGGFDCGHPIEILVGQEKMEILEYCIVYFMQLSKEDMIDRIFNSAVLGGKMSVLKLLEKHGVSRINFTTFLGAVYSGDVKMIQMAISSGCIKDIPDDFDGFTMLEHIYKEDVADAYLNSGIPFKMELIDTFFSNLRVWGPVGKFLLGRKLEWEAYMDRSPEKKFEYAKDLCHLGTQPLLDMAEFVHIWDPNSESILVYVPLPYFFEFLQVYPELTKYENYGSNAYTPFFLALRMCMSDEEALHTAEKMISLGLKATECVDDGTCVSLAARKSFPKTVRYLLANNGSLFIPSKKNIPVMCKILRTCFKSAIQCLDIFIEFGADMQAPFLTYEHVLDYYLGHALDVPDVFNYLKGKCKLKYTCSGHTPISRALLNKHSTHYYALKYFIENQIYKLDEIANGDGETVLTLLVKHGASVILGWIVTHISPNGKYNNLHFY